MNLVTSRGISARRSRSGGRCTGNHRQTIVEILAERLGLDQVGQILIGGRNDTDVDLDGLGTADRLISPSCRTRSNFA